MSQRNNVDLMELFAMRTTEMSELLRDDLRFYGTALSIGRKRIAPRDYGVDTNGAIIWPLEDGGPVGMVHPEPRGKIGFQTAQSPSKSSLKDHAELLRYCLADVPGKTLKINPVPRTCLDAVGFTAR